MATSEGLFRRVALTSLVVTAIVFGALAARFPWPVSISFVLGVATGLASLGTLEWLVAGLTTGDAADRRRRLLVSGALQLAKYGLIGLAFYALFASGAANGPALAAGVTLPTAVLCLKEAGRKVNKRLGVAEGQARISDE